MVSEISSSIETAEVIILPTEVQVPKEEEGPVVVPTLEPSLLEKILEKGGSRQDFQRALELKFGQAFPLSQLSEQITPRAALITLGKMGHQLTLDALETYFAEIKAGIIERDQLPYLRLWWASRAQDLPPFWFNYLVEQFREEKIHAQIEELGMGESVPFAYYDWLVKRCVQLGDRNNPTFSFASRELLARIIAYTDSKEMCEGMLLPIYNEQQGKLFYYQLSGQVHDAGLHAYLFTPLNKDLALPAQLIFCGTNSLPGAQRDADPNGVGKWTFQLNREKIYNLVQNFRNIEVIGHSLGAADAQRAVALIVDPKREHNVNSISLYAFCSPKLDRETVQEWKTNLQALETANKHPMIRLYYAQHIKDFVTWTGDSNLWGADSDHIYSAYLVIHSNTPLHHIAKHHSIPFFKNGCFDFETDERTFELYESLPKAELEHYLQELETRKAEYRWLGLIKGLFVSRETTEEIEKRIEIIKEHQAKVQVLEKGEVEQSWVVWIATRTVNYTLQPLVYYSLAGIGRLLTRD